MTDRNKLICLLSKICPIPYREITKVADCLVKNGYTIATDNKVGDKITPAEPMTNCQQWIPVTERLPDLSGDYLTNTRVRFPSIGDVDDLVEISIYEQSDGRWIALDGGKVHVTHWMPLPDAPKE